MGVPVRGPQEAAGSLLSHPPSVRQKTAPALGAEGPLEKLRLKLKLPLLSQSTVIFRQVKLVSVAGAWVFTCAFFGSLLAAP